MNAMAHIERELHDRVFLLAAKVLLFHVNVRDIRVCRGDFGRELGEYAAPVVDGHADIDAEQPVNLGIPLHIDPFFRIKLEWLNREAIVGMDNEALSALDLREDRVARDRPTTHRELHRHVFGAANGDRVTQFVFRRHQIGDRKQFARDHHRETFAQTDFGEHRFFGFDVVAFQQAIPVNPADRIRIKIERAH